MIMRGFLQVPPMVAEVTHRVFFQPSGIDANPASPSFCLDFWTYRSVDLFSLRG